MDNRQSDANGCIDMRFRGHLGGVLVATAYICEAIATASPAHIAPLELCRSLAALMGRRVAFEGWNLQSEVGQLDPLRDSIDCGTRRFWTRSTIHPASRLQRAPQRQRLGVLREIVKLWRIVPDVEHPRGRRRECPQSWR